MNPRDLGKIYTADGPFVTLYLSVRRDVEDAAQRYETQWKDVLSELAGFGVDETTRDALVAARGDHSAGGTHVMVASHGLVHLSEALPEPLPESAADIVRYSPLPHLLPLIEMVGPRIPHIVVLTDRIGADILAYQTGPEPTEVGSVDGADYHIRKVHAGGWSMRHYQAHAEENWAHNAKDVVDVVEKLALDINPRVIIVGGDVRAVQLFEKYLPAGLLPRLQLIEGSRATDGGTEHVADRVMAVLADTWRADTNALLDKFAEEVGQADRATNGLVDTVAALRLAQVETLILSDALDGDRPLWFGPDPAVIGVTRDEADLGFGAPQQAAAVDVVVRTAIGTDATVRVVPSNDPRSPREGTGAILRFRLG
ncbi:MAG: hypothetical protein QOG53_826 [Frankiales bacterium]|jgi:hypothetical protein|nr:hypothetical protein [Frankiales bacterium]